MDTPMAVLQPNSGRSDKSERMQPRAFVAFLAALVTLVSVPATAQAPTGSVSGRVESSDGLPLPGVTVSLTSDHLQGVRSTVTSDSGDYHMPLLPPGVYRIAFELSGFQTATRSESLSGTQRVTVDITMALAAI